jgi:uncharacterized membrane protein
MINVPINAKVSCKDGHCGKSTGVIIDPVTQRVTHFTVEDQTSRPAVERLVPVEEVLETTSETIELKCSQDIFSQMEPFIQQRFIEANAPEMNYDVDTYKTPYGMGAYYAPYSVPSSPDGKMMVSVEEKQVPSGELGIYRGSTVESVDGVVGHVESFLVNPISGRISHLVLQTGPLYSKKQVTLPVSVIEDILDEKVSIALDKEAVESLPAIPVRPAWSQVHVTDIELLVAAFKEMDDAEQALQALRKLDREDDIVDILNAAVIQNDADGKFSVRETGDVDVKRGTLFGAIAGGLLGLIGGPVGVVLGAVAGAATGRVSADWIDMGFPDDFLENLKQEIKPDSSALVVMVTHAFSDQVVQTLAEMDGKLFRQTIPDAMVDKLMKAIESGNS